MSKQNDWSAANLSKLKSLLQKGLSTAEIGKRLGMTKNAVVGKLNRLGWNPKAQAEPKKSVEKTAGSTKAIKKILKLAVVKKSPPAAKSKAKTQKNNSGAASAKAGTKMAAKSLLMHQRIVQHSLAMANLRPDQCRWPIGDPDSENFRFCGAKVFAGKPYCYEHCKQAYQFAPMKKK